MQASECIPRIRHFFPNSPKRAFDQAPHRQRVSQLFEAALVIFPEFLIPETDQPIYGEKAIVRVEYFLDSLPNLIGTEISRAILDHIIQ